MQLTSYPMELGARARLKQDREQGRQERIRARGPDVPKTRKGKKTFGVEIEFALAVVDNGKDDPDPNDSRHIFGIDQPVGHHNLPDKIRIGHILQHIADLLAIHEIPAVAVIYTMDFEKELIYKEALSFSWLITQDSSILIENLCENYTWYQIEINSPPYFFEPEALAKVDQVCRLLSSTYRIQTNAATGSGVHVHIGNNTAGLSDNSLRFLYSTIWTFEPQLQTIHPYNRKFNGRKFNSHCAPLREGSQMSNRDLKRFKPEDRPSRGLETLLQTNTNNEIVDLVKDFDKGPGAYNIEHMAKPWDLKNTKITIEFRQHESTLSPDRITNWIEVCHGLVEFCDNVKPSLIEQFLRDHINDSIWDFGIEKVLASIGLPDQAKFYASRLFLPAREEPSTGISNKPRVIKGERLERGGGGGRMRRGLRQIAAEETEEQTQASDYSTFLDRNNIEL